MRFRAISRLSAVSSLVLLCCGGARAAGDWQLRVLAPLCVGFGCSSSALPGPLTIDRAGHVFGMLPYAGLHGNGYVFELLRKPDRHKRTMRKIYHFCALLSCRDGAQPMRANLVVDRHGNLYGTASEGGSRAGGVLFRLTMQGGGKNWNLTVLYDFCSQNSACTDGGAPQGPLAYQGQGAGLPYDGVSPLYGTTRTFGAHGHGTVFSLQPKHGREKWRETTLYSFCAGRFGPNCADGGNPYGVTLDAAGNLIGVALYGTHQEGVLFKLSPIEGQRRWSETVLHTFCSLAACADGRAPSDVPFVDGAGNLIGLTYRGGDTQCGGNGCGTLYKVTPDGTYSVLYDFCSLANCNDGSHPVGSLIADPEGNLYGATADGGPGRNDLPQAVGGGTIFEFSGGALATLHAFCTATGCPDGRYPGEGVAMSGSGRLFGTTTSGGPQNTGEVFKMNPL